MEGGSRRRSGTTNSPGLKKGGFDSNILSRILISDNISEGHSEQGNVGAKVRVSARRICDFLGSARREQIRDWT
jgi:hypothetical protein